MFKYTPPWQVLCATLEPRAQVRAGSLPVTPAPPRPRGGSRGRGGGTGILRGKGGAAAGGHAQVKMWQPGLLLVTRGWCWGQGPQGTTAVQPRVSAHLQAGGGPRLGSGRAVPVLGSQGSFWATGPRPCPLAELPGASPGLCTHPHPPQGVVLARAPRPLAWTLSQPHGKTGTALPPGNAQPPVAAPEAPSPRPAGAGCSPSGAGRVPQAAQGESGFPVPHSWGESGFTPLPCSGLGPAAGAGPCERSGVWRGAGLRQGQQDEDMARGRGWGHPAPGAGAVRAEHGGTGGTTQAGRAAWCQAGQGALGAGCWRRCRAPAPVAQGSRSTAATVGLCSPVAYNGSRSLNRHRGCCPLPELLWLVPRQDEARGGWRGQRGREHRGCHSARPSPACTNRGGYQAAGTGKAGPGEAPWCKQESASGLSGDSLLFAQPAGSSAQLPAAPWGQAAAPAAP